MSLVSNIVFMLVTQCFHAFPIPKIQTMTLACWLSEQTPCTRLPYPNPASGMASPSYPPPPRACRLDISFPRALEEEANHEYLQSAHADDKTALDQAEVDDPLLGASNGAEVAVLAGAEVLLVAGHGGQLARDLDDGLLEGGGLLGRGAFLGGKIDACLVLNLEVQRSVSKRLQGNGQQVWYCGRTHSNLKVDKLVGNSAHLVVEAE